MDDEGITWSWITIKYKHCKIGQRLKAPGHTLGTREYAEGTDPFKSGSEVRYLALQQYGVEFDDSGCYPTALCALCPLAQDMCTRFINNRKETLDKVGSFYFPNITDDKTRREKKKTNPCPGL